MSADPETVREPQPTRGPVLRTPHRDIAKSISRVLVVNVVLMTLYWVLPLGQRLSSGVLLWLGIALLSLGAVVGWEIRTINRSRYPELRAVEAGGTALPVALLPFAATYYALADNVAGSFGGHLTRLDALYFTITTFATVGFGDIVPRSEAARAIVTVQMAVDLLLIGFIARALVRTARLRRSALVDDDPEA